MTDQTDILMIGADQAGAYTAIALRHQGFNGMINEEVSLPYERPPLPKADLKGEKAFACLLIHPQNFSVKRHVSLLMAQRVRAIDPTAHCTTIAKGLVISYGQWIRAARGQTRCLTCKGADLPGIYSLRTRANEAASAILAGLEKTERSPLPV